MGIWTTVNSAPAENPIKFVDSDGNKVSHSDIIGSIDEAHKGYWFWSHPLAPTGHTQTFMATKPHDDVDRVYYGRRLFTLKDGATVSIDYEIPHPESEEQWAEDVKYAPREGLPRYPARTRYLRPEEVEARDSDDITKPIVIHLHGLTGGSHESYVRSAICGINREGDFENVVITARGCNRSPITTPQLFCALWTDDIRNFVQHVRSLQPNRRIYAVGYSLGAAILANYIGQEQETSVLSGACIVAAPWDLFVNSMHINTSFVGKNLYNKVMAANLERVLRNNKDVMMQSEEFRERYSKGKVSKTIIEFDSQYTAPLFGFDTADDYYRCASPVHRLRDIRTPCLILCSEDDPICSVNAVPFADARLNPYCHILSTSTGGHLGWFGTSGPRWHSSVVGKYFSSLQAVDTRQIHAEIHYARRKFNGNRLIMD